MGGLIAYYAVLKHNNIFGKAGVFSPAFWTAPAIQKLTDTAGNNIKGSIFFYMGGKEGTEALDNMAKIETKLSVNTNLVIHSVIDPAGSHNEQAWRKWFAEFYTWIMK